MILNRKSLVLMLVDSVLINLAAFGSFYLRFEGDIPQEYFLTYYHIITQLGLAHSSIYSSFPYSVCIIGFGSMPVSVNSRRFFMRSRSERVVLYSLFIS